MKTFKSITDVEHARHHPLQATIKSLVVPVINEYADYRPEDDGYLVLIELADVDRVLDDLDMPWRLSEVPFEGVSMIGNCFYAVYIPNNQFSLGFLIPDAEWVTGDVRRHLEDHLDP
ncbi:MAG: hypothetical protein ABFS45_13280 [Pseudomonadota bacterium]